MGVLKSIANFLLGKDAEIFDDKGRVQHKLPQRQWDAWHQRTKMDPQNNWRNHSGMSAGNKKH